MAGDTVIGHKPDRRPRTAVDAVRCRGRRFHGGSTPEPTTVTPVSGATATPSCAARAWRARP